MQQYSQEQFGSSLILFTDGSSLGNPGPGGYGCVAVFPRLDEIVELGGNKTKTTNNEMELSAVIAGLSHTMSNSAPVEVFTDSSYVINGVTKWVFGWEKNGWKTQTKDDVANKQLWQTLIQLVRERKTIVWHYVPGHVGVVANERCDEIATSFAGGKAIKLFRGKLSDYQKETGKDILNFSIDEELSKEKSEKRSKANVKAYSYLSLVDGVPMRHTTWAECEARVKGVRAKFKKTASKEDEDAILKEWGVHL